MSLIRNEHKNRSIRQQKITNTYMNLGKLSYDYTRRNEQKDALNCIELLIESMQNFEDK